MFEHLEGALLTRRHGVVTWTSATRLPLLNGAFGIPDGSLGVDEAIDDVLRRFDEKRLPLQWVVPPPNDLSAALARRGLTVELAPGMALELAALTRVRTPPGVAVAEVDDQPDRLRAATRISFAANGFPPPAAEAILQMLDRIPDRHRVRTFLATVDGQPAAACSLFEATSVAGLYNVGTIPEMRRRGLGALVSATAIAAARDHGFSIGVLQASPAGEPVYRALGFEEHCRIAFASRR